MLLLHSIGIVRAKGVDLILLIKKIDEFLGSLFPPNNLLNKMAQYHFSTGGKRLRALLVIQEAEHFGVSFEQALPWAASVELLHNSTLVHDDIQDNDELRRGLPTVWKKYGLPQAINLGNLMIFKAFETSSLAYSPDVSKKLSQILSQSAEDIVRGQSREFEISNLDYENFWIEYCTIAKLKTGALLKAGIEGASAITLQKVPLEPWLHIGLVYQIEDDINDFLGDKQKTQIQKDFTEKKVNSLVAWFARDPKNWPLVKKYLKSEDCTEIIMAIKNSNTLAELNLFKEKLLFDFNQSVPTKTKQILIDKTTAWNKNNKDIQINV